MTATTFIGHFLGPDTHTNRPSATGLPNGTIYVCTTHSKLERVVSGAWADYATLGAAGAARALSTFSTASLAPNASGTVYWNIAGRTFQLLQVQTERPARVRLYTSPTKRDADASRAIGTDPAPNGGCLLELVTDASNLVYDLSVMPIIASTEGSSMNALGSQASIAGSVQNLDTATGVVTVHFVALTLES